MVTRTKKLTVFFLFLLCVALVMGIWMMNKDVLTFEALKEGREVLHFQVEQHYTASVILFLLLYIAVTSFALPVTLIFALASGILFGWILGGIYVCIATTIGALVSFSYSRYFVGHLIQNKYKSQLKNFNDEMQHHGHNYLLILRFAQFPFFLINVFAGITRIPLKTFLWTTFVGIIPSAFIISYAGSQLNTIQSASDIVMGKMMIFLLLLAFLASLPIIYKKYKHKIGRLYDKK